ncbi:hypothetical protein MY04_3537 [Flammeovirga sp. MY04]|uniref:hypothetical protein n=1 Tax=Flammeovirga sp. MY04 TaxID=1191459 RepID=UPI0008062C1E|nr:hypothetical protein [Flammeovirga sp. MY04]ANQ50888.1 hypothetical protein MY04_3537 [Flammeovirga sp. MY04]
MNKILTLITSIFFMSVVMLSCQTSTKERTSTNYPNGGSELAWLMRDVTDQMEAQRKAIIEGDSLQKFPLDVAHILTAIPTEEGKTSSPQYKTLADNFLKHVNQSKDIQLAGQVEFYNGTVSLCVNCHETQCPGPNVRIKKLYITE